MTSLRGLTPTPAQLGRAVRDTFGPVLEQAGGADGRISLASAKRIAARDDFGWIVSDNAVRYLEATGQKTVSARVLTEKLGDYAEREAADHAGANQRLSLVEARALPRDLQAEFFYLRGKGLPERVQPRDLKAAVEALVREKLDDGSLVKLDRVPWEVRGQRPLIENIPHPASHTRAIVYLARGEVFVSRAAPAGPGQGLVGWYSAGPAPELEPS